MSLMQRAKVEGLKAEAEAIKETHEAELKAKLLRVKQKIKKAEAIEKVYAQSAAMRNLTNAGANKGTPSMNALNLDEKKTNLTHTTDLADKTAVPINNHCSTSDLHLAMIDMMKLQCAPRPDLDIFSGDPLEYCYFKTIFKEVVETAVPDQRGRLTRLIKYTNGDAKELIKHLVHADPTNCYNEAVALLDKEYGNDHILSCSYIKELRQWESVKQHDTTSFKKLYRFLLKCQAYRSGGRLVELDSTDMIRTVLSKVHTTHQERWNRKAIDIRKKQKREADFSDLVKFIEMEAALLSDPAYSRDALLEAKNQMKSFSTQLQDTPIDKDLHKSFKQCPVCSSTHDVEDCEEYLNKDINERHKMIFRLKLCFGCLEPVSNDHLAKTCEKKRKCRVCNSEHPTTLHGGKTATVYHSSLEGNVISMCVVPVQLHHKNHPEKNVTVYALLDDCSQATFIHEDILECLDISEKMHTSISVTTLNGEQRDTAIAVDGLIAKCTPDHSKFYPASEAIKLPRTYSRSSLAVDVGEIPTPANIASWNHLRSLVTRVPDYDPAIPIGLMIGGNCPTALEPLEVMQSVDDGPYAKRSRLGWCVIGPIGIVPEAVSSIHSNCTRANIPVKDASSGQLAKHHFTTESTLRDTFVTDMLKEMYTAEFSETAGEKIALSVEDEKFIAIMEKGVCKVNGHYQLPLPFRDESLLMPNNRAQALTRLNSIKRRFEKNAEYKDKYVSIIEKLITKGYARKSNRSRDEIGKIWYAPHHGVYNKQKGKLRVVHDFSVTYKGRCLNDELIQGPDMTNSLVGVLVRSRKGPVAIMADIEGMYHQVGVPESQRCFLRFLWWPDGNTASEPEDHEMCVHPFGAISSGGCANFALRRTAMDSSSQFKPEITNILCRDFYVDDLLKSTDSAHEAKTMIRSIREVCAQGGFNLSKVISNSRDVISSLPLEWRSPSVVDLDLSRDLPIERALGIHWCIQNDTFNFHIVMQDKPLTRRGILGTISSIYDPLGLASPFILPGRKILQQITMENSSWDDDLPPGLSTAWEKWREDLPLLEGLQINRCYKPDNSEVVSSSLHSFSDASDYGYGTASYLRQVNTKGKVHVSLVMGKSRVVPSKPTTVPRLELTAALVSAKVGAMLKEELDIEGLSVTYWIDSMIVLGYIRNDLKRFRTFVTNRKRKISHLAEKEQFRHINTHDNPADDASRGLCMKDEAKVERWFNGPCILWEKELPPADAEVQAEVPDDDPEVMKSTKSNVCQVNTCETSIIHMLETRISSWLRMKRVIARVLVSIDRCRGNGERKGGDGLTVADLLRSEEVIVRMLQATRFHKEISSLKAKGKVVKSSQLVRLDPILDDRGTLRVGGRLKRSSLDSQVKHPVILPKNSILVKRMIEWYHEDIQHLGRTSTLNELRTRGYWVINGNAQVRTVIFKCVRCKLFRGQPSNQKMSDLPETRVTDAPPFTYCGVDMFGPFLVKEGRKEVKRYGMIFTCFSCRAIHLETTISADTDSFILSLRRFIARRGPARSIRSDNGGNFVGADNEFKDALLEMDHEKIKNFLHTKDCDWIEWERNPPISSHFGGVLERQIRSVRNVLASLLKSHAGRLNDESLRTLLTEVEAIVNSRPLTVQNLSDETVVPLTPNHLLTMKSKVVLPPPGVFQKADVYCRKRWRAVQYLCNEFWDHWRKEYLASLQERQKWSDVKRNFEVGDIVLVKDAEAARNKWPMGRITEVFESDDGLVRKVSVKTAESNQPLLRSVSKLVLLIENQSSN